MRSFGSVKAFTALVWVALGFCVVAWAMHLHAGVQVTRAMPPAAPPEISRFQPDFAAMVRALNAGASAAPTAEAPAESAAGSRFQVRGVALAGAASVALIAVDGQAAKPVRAGDELADGWVVRGVSLSIVTLRKSGSGQSLEIAVPKPAP